MCPESDRNPTGAGRIIYLSVSRLRPASLRKGDRPAVLRHNMRSKTPISANEPAHLALRLQALHDTVGPTLAFDLQPCNAIHRDSSPFSAIQRLPVRYPTRFSPIPMPHWIVLAMPFALAPLALFRTFGFTASRGGRTSILLAQS